MNIRDIEIIDFTEEQKKEIKEAVESLKREVEEKVSLGMKLSRFERMIINKPTILDRIWWKFKTR